jgi:hypothetical protein
MAALVEQGFKISLGFYTGLLAQLEAETLGADSALARIDEAFHLSTAVEHGCSLPFLHRLRGEILLKRNPADLAPAEEAFRTSIAVAKEQGARSPVLLASLALAKLLQSTGRSVDAHAVLTPALEGFASTPEMPEIAEAKALFATLADTEEVKAAEARRQRRLHLQTAYGQATMMTKGYAAEETKAAFAQAAELARRTRDFSERFAALQGQFAAATAAGELRSARELALTLSREADEAGLVSEVGIANWWLGLIAYWHGDFVEARAGCERATIDIQDPNADPKVRERFGDLSTYPQSILAATMWQMGEVERARELINTAIQRASETHRIQAIVDALFWRSYLEIWRGDPVATLSAADTLERVAHEHLLPQHLNEAELHLDWARGRINDPKAGAAQVQRALAAFVDQGARVNLGFYTGLLAQLEAETLGADGALARIEEAFRLSEQVEHGCSLPFLHRLRGEILLKHNPADPVPAEKAFRSSIAIAKEQGARSPVLLASLALAKLLQSTGRHVEAHAVLTPALEEFSPTPEMSQIAEALTLLAALAETEEVKAAEARRQQRLYLQTAYSHALMWGKGFAAQETKAALASAAELAGKTGDFSEHFTAVFSQWAAAITRGELRLAGDLAFALLRQAEDAGRVMETGSANRALGLIAFIHGDFVGARTHYERALIVRDPKPDPKHWDERPYAFSHLAVANWALGEVERARQQINSATRCAAESDIPSIVDTLFWKSYLEIWRGDPFATLHVSEALGPLAREHGMTQYLNEAELHAGWARGRINDPIAGSVQVRKILAALVDQGVKVNLGFYTGLLAQLEAETLGAESALARIDEAFRLSEQVGHRCSLPFLHRFAGRNPAEARPL